MEKWKKDYLDWCIENGAKESDKAFKEILESFEEEERTHGVYGAL